jgi:hypothetical protein
MGKVHRPGYSEMKLVAQSGHMKPDGVKQTLVLNFDIKMKCVCFFKLRLIYPWHPLCEDGELGAVLTCWRISLTLAIQPLERDLEICVLQET